MTTKPETEIERYNRVTPTLKEPTAEQCEEVVKLYEDESEVCYALWYPSMGGYVGKAIARIPKTDEPCVEFLVWHNGEFPFTGQDKWQASNPVELHHCSPDEFENFGKLMKKLIYEN